MHGTPAFQVAVHAALSSAAFPRSDAAHRPINALACCPTMAEDRDLFVPCNEVIEPTRTIVRV